MRGKYGKSNYSICIFLICFNISGLATTNILRLTSGNILPGLSSKCYCENCKTTIPVDALILEIIVLADLFIILLCFDYSVVGVTVCFISYEIIRAIVIIRKGKRENNFMEQYVVSVFAMIPHYVMTVFVSLLYGIVCSN